MQTDIAERMLANRKQRERGKEVEENASSMADHANDHDEDKGLAEEFSDTPLHQAGTQAEAKGADAF